jgi:hypothetical protein
MTIAYTDPAALKPSAFEAGLHLWSGGDGTSSSAGLDGVTGAVVVTGDGDFGSCLELVKTQSTQSVRWFTQTELQNGQYLRIRVSLKALSGSLPTVRAAATPVDASGDVVTGLTTYGPENTFDGYGSVIEVSAIIGGGSRDGVDLAWGQAAQAGHFGFDLTGSNGGVLRIDDVVIEDVTALFLPQMVGTVDVRDYGAVGDGITDDSAAFAAADAAANGLEVLVPEGTYRLESDVTFENAVRFAGNLSMPVDAKLVLQKNYDLRSYMDAFTVEAEAFGKAFQALLNNGTHDTLDMCGRRVQLDEPLDVQAMVPNKETYATRRVVRNGQFEAKNSSGWDDTEVTSRATYNPASAYYLSDVENVANIPVGALVEGVGVGREVYVRSVDVAAGSVRISGPLYNAEGTQIFTFRRFKYLLDLSGFSNLAKFGLSDIEFRCNGRSSGLMIAPAGIGMHIRDCVFTRPKDRGLSSPGEGCQGMMVDRCVFLSDESPKLVQERTSIAMNATGNDVKIRDGRFVHFKHSMVLAGAGNLISGNHWFQGDSASNGIRAAGLIISQTNCKTTITGNYIDNNYILWANEHDQYPDQSNEFSFGGLTVNGNIFTVNDVSDAFRFMIVRPHGEGHFLSGVSIGNNVFRALNGNIQRVDDVDTTYAELNWGRTYNVMVVGNVFNAVEDQIRNPLVIKHSQNTAAGTWTVGLGANLPFRATARTVEAVYPEGPLQDDAGTTRWPLSYAEVEQGSSGSDVTLHWETPVKGRVTVTARIDNPI